MSSSLLFTEILCYILTLLIKFNLEVQVSVSILLKIWKICIKSNMCKLQSSIYIQHLISGLKASFCEF